MTWRDRIEVLHHKLAVGTQRQEVQDRSETEKVEWLEELETMENEHHVILHEISMEINPGKHQEKGFSSLDVTNPQALMQLEASGQRAQEIGAIKEQQRQIMNAEKNIVWEKQKNP